MKIIYDWLNQFVEIPEKINDLANILYSLGFGIESITNDVIELEITPNRGDALSIYGLAREYGAYKGGQIKPYKIKYSNNNVRRENNKVKIKTDQITSYYGIVIDNISIIKSSEIIQERLNKIGINNINNIVDITNYIMHETGVPLHAYDLNKINNQIQFNLTCKIEKITALNNKEYKLPVGTLVAYDGNNIIDIIGIQGGLSTAVDKNTKKILLHAPNINKNIIRKTSKSLNLATPASYRYERSIDNDMLESAVLNAYSLIKESCNCNLINTIDYKKDLRHNSVTLDWNNISKLLGTKISEKKSYNILTSLGFIITDDQINVPSWRHYDIDCEEDLVEEVARIYGYNNLIPKKFKPKTYSKSINDEMYDLINSISQRLLSIGYSEIMTYSFISEEFIGKNIGDYTQIKNPLSNLYKYLRNSLIPLLIEAGENNLWMPEIKLFEIGSVFDKGIESIKAAILSTKKIDCIENAVKINQYPNGVKTRRSYFVYENNLKNVSKLIPGIQSCTQQTVNDYQPISKYPPAVRDISFITGDNYNIKEIIAAVYCEDIVSINIVDIYKSDKFDKNSTSYCLRVIINNKDNKLTTHYIDGVIKNITHKLNKLFLAVIR